MRAKTLFLWIAVFFMLFSALGGIPAEAEKCTSCNGKGYPECPACYGS